jgi:hypothetical protein
MSCWDREQGVENREQRIVELETITVGDCLDIEKGHLLRWPFFDKGNENSEPNIDLQHHMLMITYGT